LFFVEASVYQYSALINFEWEKNSAEIERPVMVLKINVLGSIKNRVFKLNKIEIEFLSSIKKK
jgi:hypothetical protein